MLINLWLMLLFLPIQLVLVDILDDLRTLWLLQRLHRINLKKWRIPRYLLNVLLKVDCRWLRITLEVIIFIIVIQFIFNVIIISIFVFLSGGPTRSPLRFPPFNWRNRLFFRRSLRVALYWVERQRTNRVLWSLTRLLSWKA